jgi:hypothetical protein
VTACRALATAFATLSAALLSASCNGDSAAAARNMDASIAASETVMLSFRESVRGISEGKQANRAQDLLSLRAPDSLDACSSPLPAEDVTRYTTDLITIELPADFKLTRNGDSEPMKKIYGYSRYEWTGSDRSVVTIDQANNDDGHSGWTGLIESECNVDIGPRPAHLDVANATVEFQDRVVHASIDMVPQLALRFVAHARSRRRQAELLSAVHTLRIRSAWGQKK